MNRIKPLALRFAQLHIPEPNSGCWLWLGEIDRKGYGQINLGNATSGKRKRRMAHAVAYELHCTPIPRGLELDHLCRNTLCVNPDHLEPVTHKENVRRGMAHGAIVARTNTCMRGHALTDSNTYWSRGRRWCRACRVIHEQNRQRKKHA